MTKEMKIEMLSTRIENKKALMKEFLADGSTLSNKIAETIKAEIDELQDLLSAVIANRA